jgi:hypothetical protein
MGWESSYPKTITTSPVMNGRLTSRQGGAGPAGMGLERGQVLP